MNYSWRALLKAEAELGCGCCKGRTTQARTMLWDLLGQIIAWREVKGCEDSIPKLQKDVDMPGGGGGDTGLQHQCTPVPDLAPAHSQHRERKQRGHIRISKDGG